MVRFGLVAVLACISFIGAVDGKSVSGYVKKDGAYVAPHQRSAPNSTWMDNYNQGLHDPVHGERGVRGPQ